MIEKLTLYDPRALLGDAAAPTRPDEASSVAACFDDPDLRLRLRAHKQVQAYEAWLWEGNDGQAYYSKKLANGKTMAWRPGGTADFVLNKNPSLKRGRTRDQSKEGF